MQTFIKGLVDGGEEMANVTGSSLFVFIPMALKFRKCNLLTTDMT